MLGLGNDILCDDRIGLEVVRRLGELPPSVAVREAAVGGMALLECFVGYRRGIIVDAERTGQRAPGSVRHLSLDSLETLPHLRSAHDADLPTSLELGRRLGFELPTHIDVVAIEVMDTETFGEVMCDEVAAAVPRAVALVRRLLEDDRR